MSRRLAAREQAIQGRVLAAFDAAQPGELMSIEEIAMRVGASSGMRRKREVATARSADYESSDRRPSLSEVRGALVRLVRDGAVEKVDVGGRRTARWRWIGDEAGVPETVPSSWESVGEQPGSADVGPRVRASEKMHLNPEPLRVVSDRWSAALASFAASLRERTRADKLRVWLALGGTEEDFPDD